MKKSNKQFLVGGYVMMAALSTYLLFEPRIVQDLALLFLGVGFAHVVRALQTMETEEATA